MSGLHVLAGGQCALHVTVPAGNNSAGVAWRTAIVNSGMGGQSVMAVGVGAGQITQTERDQITAGEVYEIVFQVDIPAGASAAQRNAIMDAQIATVSAETQARIAQSLRWFGLTRG